MSYSALFQRILAARGLWRSGKLTAAGRAWLQPDFATLEDPLALPDMAAAVARLRQARQQGERVLVFGDYDADGVTGAALLVLALRQLGYQVVYDLPERATDGYGLPARLVEEAPAQGVSLIVTVDCGSRDGVVIAALAKVGVEVIVTDHHEIAELPPAVAVVNPKRAEATGFRDYAGVGVAWQLARALGLEEPAAKWLLDLVAIGTVCDLMPLAGVNRTLVYYGLVVLEKTRRPGLGELLRLAGVTKAVTAETIGFRIGPRLNAAGRIASPRQALELLLAEQRASAARLAQELERLNEQRQRLVEQAVAEIDGPPSDGVGALLVSGHWHEGIIGLLASRLVEQTGVTSFVFTESAGCLKGSARAAPGDNVVELIEAGRAAGLVQKGGGHAAAGGLTIRPEDFAPLGELLAKRAPQCAPTLSAHPSAYCINNLAELSVELCRELQLLAPYGPGNSEPLFGVTGRLSKITPLGSSGQHWALVLVDEQGATLRLVQWRAPVGLAELPLGEPMAALFYLREDTWNGKSKIEGELVAITPA